jgi:FkbM family methyltransferase
MLKNFIQKNPWIFTYILENFRKTGFDIISGPDPSVALLKKYGISLIFDVGANVGQFALRTKSRGYKGKIISFEPLSSAFRDLSSKAARDPLWTAENFGCGNYDGEAQINVSEQSVYSSILEPLSWLQEEAPGSTAITTEKIKISRIDSIFEQYYQTGDQVLLKIDTQGFEKNVLEGADCSLNHVTGIQLELSFVEHYEGEVLFENMLKFLDDKGFTLVNLQPLTHQLETGNSLRQADGMFFRLS